MPETQHSNAKVVSVIIVSYNSASHILSCLSSVYDSHSIHSLEIVVIDNASQDASVELVDEHYPEVCLIKNTENCGFAAACNQGLTCSHGELILLLNPDALLIEDTIQKLSYHLETHPQAGIVGPRLFDLQGDAPRDTSVTGIFPGFRQAIFEYTLLRKLAPESRWIKEYQMKGCNSQTSQRAAMVQGACFMFRSELLGSLHGLDEQFFLYFEETDFCARARAIGWETHYVAAAGCRHAGGHSMPNGTQHTKEFFNSFYRYHRKHNGWLCSFSLRIILTLSFLMEFCLLRLCSPFISSKIELSHSYFVSRVRLLSHLPFVQ